MPPALIFPVDRLDPNKIIIPIEAIREVNQQRFEMEQLAGILYYDPVNAIIVGFKDVAANEFWVRGHIPGRPLMPGVLICECAAQLCSFLYGKAVGHHQFLGFGGLEQVKFRHQVAPGDRLLMIAKAHDLRTRRAVFQTQGVVNGRLVYEGVIIGMPM